MKPILQFIRTTITGGVLFMLPFTLLIIVMNKVREVLIRISEPLADQLPDIFLGFDGSKAMALVLLVILCFFAGLLFRMAAVKRWITRVEDSVLSHFPGYAMLKSVAADTVGERADDNLITVLIKDGDGWKIGFRVEEGDGYCTVFIPDAPRFDSGDVVILPASDVKRVEIPSHLAVKSIKNFGKGSIQWIKKVL